MESEIEFEAEIVEVKVRITASSDKEITIKMRTDDIIALRLQEYIADKTIKIKVYDK
jgi:hypothetical protein